MKTIEDMRSYLESEEGKAYIKRMAEEQANKQTIKEEKMKAIFSSYDYINWLCGFILKHQSFMDDDWTYFPERISEEDNNRLQDLHLLFEGIQKYAMESGMSEECYDNVYGSYYNVKVNGIGFRLGVMHGQGVHCACSIVSIKNENDFIDLADTISFGTLNPKLQNLSQSIKLAYENGCTRDEIMDVVNSTVEKLSFEEEDKPFTIKKQG